MDKNEQREETMIGEKGVWPIAKQYGIIGGLVLIIYFLIANLLQVNYPINPLGFILYSIISLFVRVGILIYPLRLDAEEYPVNLKRSFFLSFTVGLIAFTIDSGFDTFFVTVIDPEFLNNYFNSVAELYRNTEMEKELVEANVKLIKELAENRKYFLSNMLGVAMQSAFMAFMVSLAFVRGERRKGK